MALANLNAPDRQRDANHQARDFAYGTRPTPRSRASSSRISGSRARSTSPTTRSSRGSSTSTTSAKTDQVALDLKKELAVAGQTADHWAVTTDGKMVAFNKQGGVLRYSAESPARSSLRAKA
jgi:BRCT domain type II-containing protein